MSLPSKVTEDVPGSASTPSCWFNQDVHAHDAALRGYLRSAFPSVRDVDDVVQESYLRIWKARALQPIRSARSFLFHIARHLAIDAVRHEARSPISTLPDLATLEAPEDSPSIAVAISAKEEAVFLARALDSLPPRCREVMVLRQTDGLTQREIARRLGISELTVQTHVVQGIRRLKAYFRNHGFLPSDK